MSGRRPLAEELYLFDVFLGVPGKQLALPAPTTVTEKEKAFLTEVDVSAEMTQARLSLSV